MARTRSVNPFRARVGTRRRRRRGGWGVWALVVLAAVWAWHEQRPRILEETVVEVLDGDSLVVVLDGERRQIRLYGVDSPERGQPYADRAREFTRSTALDQRVKVSVRDEDLYGRWVSEVTLPDGRVLNELLVQEGWAWWYRRHAKTDRALARWEGQARREGRGLWADPSPVPPWDYRASRREASGARP